MRRALAVVIHLGRTSMACQSSSARVYRLVGGPGCPMQGKIEGAQDSAVLQEGLGDRLDDGLQALPEL
eukprot:6264106-Pyramimonas_sp.AAC.1